MPEITFPVEYEDAFGVRWRRARISRPLLKEIQAEEERLLATYRETLAKEAEGDAQKELHSEFFDVRFPPIVPYVADANGTPIDIDTVDTADAQHLYQGFWRNVWGLDPKGSLL